MDPVLPKLRVHSLAAAWAALTVLGAASADGPPSPPPQQPPCSYSVLMVPPPICPFWGPSSPTPNGFNNLGHWTGTVPSCTNPAQVRPVRWSPETGLVFLPHPPGDDVSKAYAINDSGLVAGAGFNHACIWHPDGTPEFLPVSSEFNVSVAAAVNSQGTVVGAAVWPDGTRSFIWNAGSFFFIDHWSYGLTWCGAGDISEAGHVCGQVKGKWGGNYRGFRWKDGVLEVLEPLPGAQDCTAYAVNSHGVAVGDSRFQLEDGKSYRFMPTMWVGTEAIALPLQPGYTQGACVDISDLGAILGGVATPSVAGLPLYSPTVWVNRLPVAVKPLIDAPSPVLLGTMAAINDRDQILVQGHVTPPGAYGVWTLTPERIEADLTGDCEVDGADLAALLEAWGPRRQGHPADLTGDGAVSGADLGLLLARWTSM